MKSLAFYVALVAVFALCLPAWSAPPSAKWSQLVDTTNPAGQISQAAPRPTPLQAEDDRAADDWQGTDGAPITKIVWWGDYHPGNMDSPNPSPIPTPQPTAFILRQYSNDATDPANTEPGDLITEVQIPLEKCNQTYVTSVNEGDNITPRWIHIYSYEAVLDTPWTQTKDNIYWLSIQAVFAEPPVNHWEWLNTPPKDFLGTGQVSSDGGATWTKAQYYIGPYVEQTFNFAFELNPLKLVVTPATGAPNTWTRVKIVANIPPIARNFAVYVVVTRLDKPNKPIISLVPRSRARSVKGAKELNIPCLPVKGVIKALARGTANTIPQGADVTIFDEVVSFRSPRHFLLRIGFFDPQQPMRSENDAFLLSSTEGVVE